jgi:hypothetical protein
VVAADAPPVFLRSRSGHGFEDARQVALIEEAVIDRDLRDRVVCFEQGARHRLYAPPVDVIADRALILAAEDPRQVNRMKPGPFGEARKAERAREAAVDGLDHSRDRRGVALAILDRVHRL